MQVVTLTLEDRVRALHDLEEQVAGRPSARADLALAGQLDVRAVLDTGRDPYLDRPPGPHPAVAVALRAGPDQHGAVPAAAGADPGHHDLADERAGDLAHLAAAAADVTGLRVGAWRGALTGAGGADHGRVHGEFPGGTERALGEVQLDPDRRVTAALRAAARAAARGAAAGRAEELVEQVVQGIEPRAERAGPGARRARGERVHAHVVHPALVGVGQHLVRLGDLLEPLLGLRVGVHVRVQLAGQPPVGPLDLVLGRVAADLEQRVVVGGH